MSRSVAFIRNVMVGRQGLTRDALLRVFVDAGADEPISHLATGNVSFGLTGRTEVLQNQVERDIARIIGRNEPVFIRTIAALRRAIATEPFAHPPLDDVFERCVTFTDKPVTGLDLPMTTSRRDAVVFATRGREVYSVTRRVDGRPGNPVKLIERVLGRPVTTRNWNTVEHIVGKHEDAKHRRQHD